MQRVESMARRLPQLYRDAPLLRGEPAEPGRPARGGVLDIPFTQSLRARPDH